LRDKSIELSASDCAIQNVNSRKRFGTGCEVKAAFRFGQKLLLTSNSNGRVLFSTAWDARGLDAA
jgi:hypothetical protein